MLAQRFLSLLCFTAVFSLASACGGDDEDNEADKLGVGAACGSKADCDEFPSGETGEAELQCLPQFGGGYCGLADCTSNEDCPEASLCVAHDDGRNYCFRSCLDKAECNQNRPADQESNCSANITYVDQTTSGKPACRPRLAPRPERL